MRLNIIVTIILLLILKQGLATEIAGITEKTLGVIVNSSDPESVEIAKYYQKLRNIPDDNVITVSFDYNADTLTAENFKQIFQQVLDKTNNSIQGYVLTWSKPYRVECMSITSAFALGFDKSYCAKACYKTKPIAYYNSLSKLPYRDYGIRPTMMLAGKDKSTVKVLINRGVDSDYTRPKGKAYLLSTSDKQRNVRSVIYPGMLRSMGALVDMEIVNKDFIEHKNNIFFYFTGKKHVKGIKTNVFLPGAIADHLTSAGGYLFSRRQMSVLEWIDAGVTGTYGTVVEPCNYLGKFPNPDVLMRHYLNGDSLIEAYWKSVSMPGQGVFIGEPLAKPFKGCKIKLNNQGALSFVQREPLNYVLRVNTNC